MIFYNCVASRIVKLPQVRNIEPVAISVMLSYECLWVKFWNHSWTQYPQNFNIDHMQVNYNAQYWSQVSRGHSSVFSFSWKVDPLGISWKLRQVKTSLKWKKVCHHRKFDVIRVTDRVSVQEQVFSFCSFCKSSDTKVGFCRCTIRMHCSGYNRAVTCHCFLECVALGLPGVICCGTGWAG